MYGQKEAGRKKIRLRDEMAYILGAGDFVSYILRGYETDKGAIFWRVPVGSNLRHFYKRLRRGDIDHGML